MSTKNQFTGYFHSNHVTMVGNPTNFDYVIKKLLRNFEVSEEHTFKKLRGLNAEVVSYKKNECIETDTQTHRRGNAPL